MRTMKMRSMAVAASLLLAPLLALLVAGCGQSTSPLSGAETHGTSSVTVQPGQVTLLLGKQRYGTDELLLVTIRNGLQTDIMLKGDGAGCASLQVERLVQDSWQPVSQCAPLPAGRHALVISSGGALVQRIENAHEMDSGAGWPVGAYRALLTYQLSNTGATPSDDGSTVYSAEFTIG